MLCSFNRLIYPRSTHEVEAGAYSVALYDIHDKMVNAAGERVTQAKVVGYYLPTVGDVHVELTGHWSRSVKYGLQFDMESYKPVVEQSREGIVKYLSSGFIKGIGQKTAEKIYDSFGDDTLEMLDSSPQKLLTVKGISSKKLERVLEGLVASRGARDIIIMLAPHGISPKRAVNIHTALGPNTAEIIRAHPYRLCDIHGIGFHTSDAIARSMGLDPFSSERIEAGLTQTLKDAEGKGHLCLHKNDFVQQCMQLLNTPGLSGRAVADVAYTMTCRKALSLYEDTFVYRAATAQAEQEVASRIKDLLSMDSVRYPFNLDAEINRETQALGVDLTAQQRQAIKTALTSHVCIISGGPGTGKTMIQRTLLNIYHRTFPEAHIVCCAPTGRAARRMEQCTHFTASTIHRALGIYAEDDGSWTKPHPLDADLVLVDETSMLDIHLAKSLLSAVRFGTQLILVGDADQLPSVGPGAVLSELIACGQVPVIILDKVFRQAGGSRIAINAKLIRSGAFNLEYGPDFNVVESADYDQSADTLETLYLQQVARHGLDNVALLSPFRKKTATGVNALNERLRDKINPPGVGKPEATFGNRVFRLGDKVMQIRNQDEISNGDVGYIVSVVRQSDDMTLTVDFGDGRRAEYDHADLEMLDLAYACSIHKSQGDEYACVLVSFQNGHYIMLKRPLLYTAITRAKERVTIVGDRKAIFTAIRTVDTQQRGTMLAHRIKRERAVA